MKKRQESSYRNTRQRKRIMELLRSTNLHPTANWIYEQLKNEFPSLSLGTVYRNLNILQEQGKLIRINGSTQDHFDAVVKPHPHFRCRKCEKLYDIYISEQDCILQGGDLSTGHRIEGMRVEYRGVCASCLEDGKDLS